MSQASEKRARIDQTQTPLQRPAPTLADQLCDSGCTPQERRLLFVRRALNSLQPPSSRLSR
eukprot:5820700-Prymnesium_polylepis.1